MDIILFFQSAQDKSWRDKLSGVYRFAREKDWLVQVVNHDVQSLNIRRLMAQWKPIGCLVDRAATNSSAPDRFFGDMPVVYHDQNPQKPSRMHPNLLHDSAASARLAGTALLAMDLPLYAYAAHEKCHFWCTERRNAFCQQVRDAGKKFIDLPRDKLVEAIRDLPKPCGILASDDKRAMDVFQAAKASKASIPDDIALASIDNDEMLCEGVTPGITSVRPDFEGAGYRLAQMLAEEIDARQGRRQENSMSRCRTEYYHPLKIIKRGSTRILPRSDPRVRRALEFLRCNAFRPHVMIDDVIAQMRCSRRLATLRFRELTGHSIVDELIELRIVRAKELLSETDLPIREIVHRSGYTSESFLKRIFKKRVGMTMRDWRIQHHGEC